MSGPGGYYNPWEPQWPKWILIAVLGMMILIGAIIEKKEKNRGMMKKEDSGCVCNTREDIDDK